MFRGRISAEEWGRQAPSDRCDIDDAALGTGASFIHAEQGQEGLRCPHQAKHIDVEMLFELIHGLQRERAHIGDAGIVDEAAQRHAVQSVGHGLDRRFDLVRFGNVEDKRDDVAVCLLERLTIGMLAHARKDLPALAGQIFSGGPPDAGGCACNDDSFHGVLASPEGLFE